ncbi:MAG: HEPN domain-containing protein [Rhodocyclaceae bacterium]|jgi:HEPN domain-containing protein|nr:HEPN domain-containing protein [Rhodocyclaceae bacterium]
MTPQLEEAMRLLRMAKRDHAAFAVLTNAPGVDQATVCFHAQQAAEKAIKAVMCLRGFEYRRTHDLEELAGMLIDRGETLPVDLMDLRRLTPYAVEFRYDDEIIHLVTRNEAGRIAEMLLGWAADEITRGGR